MRRILGSVTRGSGAHQPAGSTIFTGATARPRACSTAGEATSAFATEMRHARIRALDILAVRVGTCGAQQDARFILVRGGANHRKVDAYGGYYTGSRGVSQMLDHHVHMQSPRRPLALHHSPLHNRP